MNQSELEANTCSLRQARENAYRQVTIGFGFGQSQTVATENQSKVSHDKRFLIRGAGAKGQTTAHIFLVKHRVLSACAPDSKKPFPIDRALTHK